MSNNGLRRSGYNWQQDDPQGAAPQDDPLSELARLIEEDPFADFDQGRRSAAPQSRQEPKGNWPWDETAPAHEDAQVPAAREQDDYAQFEGAEWDAPQGAYGYDQDPHGERADPVYDAYGEHQAPEWSAEAAYGEEYRAEPDLYAYDERGQAKPTEQEFHFDFGFDEGAPHYDESGHMAPLAPAQRPRGRRTALFGGLALLALIGGAGAIAYREMTPGASDGPPLMVAANPKPVKVKPEEPGGAKVPNQDKIVFDRANGIAAGGKSEERIVSREEPVEAVPLRESAANGAQDAPAAGEEPKRVRTVVVRPDGTIIEEPAAAAAPKEQIVAMRETAASPGPVTLYDSGTAPASGTAASPVEAQTAPGAQEPAPAEKEPAAAENETAAGAGTAASAAVSSGVPVPPARPAGATSQTASRHTSPSFVPPSAAEERTPRRSASQADGGRPLQLVPQPVAAQPAASQPATNSQPTQVAAVAPRQADPSALVPTNGTQTAAAQPASQATSQPAASGGFPSGGYVVQVSSTRSEADAATVAARVKSQYSNVLSGYDMAVQRADLGDRGVYYRVAVGPLSDSSSAAGLCGKLKSAGLDCFVRRN